MPSTICFNVMAGLQSCDSFKIERHTVPLGYTLGCQNPAGNITLGGFEGYSSENVMLTG